MPPPWEVDYAFELSTRGYYYELAHPIPIVVSEGRIMGRVKQPNLAYVRKTGVDYRDVAPADDTDNAARAESGTRVPTPAAADPSSDATEPPATESRAATESPTTESPAGTETAPPIPVAPSSLPAPATGP